MRLSLLLLIGAVVLFVFAVIASATSDGLCLGVSYASWIAGGLLALVSALLVRQFNDASTIN